MSAEDSCQNNTFRSTNATLAVSRIPSAASTNTAPKMVGVSKSPLAIRINCPMPGGAFYVFPSIEGTGMSSKQFANDLLEKHGVACLAGESFGEYGKGCIRFSFANSMENLNAALERIKDFVTEN